MPLVTENLVAQLGGRQEGWLIRSADWNALVAAVAQVESTLSARLDALEQRVTDETTRLDGRIDDLTKATEERLATVDERLDGLDTAANVLGVRVATLEEQLPKMEEELEERITQAEKDTAQLEAAVKPVVDSAYRVTMRTTKPNYALGELADVEARISYLPGRTPESLAGKWIDFTTFYGTFRPADGFVSRGGSGDKTMSVMTDADGVARVLLHSEAAEEMPVEAAKEITAALATRVGAKNLSVADLILGADTPEDDDVKVAYQTVSLKYDREASSLRDYVDSYYLKHQETVSIGILPSGNGGIVPPWYWRQRWRDYNATVLAFAKDDSDPTTADPNRGSSSIQITFRDWVRPWLVIDYWGRLDTVSDELIHRFVPKVGITLEGSVENLRGEVSELVKNRGVVGKLRTYDAMDVAFDKLHVEGKTFMPDLSKSMRAAVGLQKSIEQNNASVLGAASQELVFKALTRSALPSRDDQVDSLGITIEKLNSDFADTTEELDGKIEARFASVGEVVDGRLETFGGTLNTTIESTVSARLTQYDAVVNAKVTTATGTFGSRVATLEGSVTSFGSRIGSLEGTVSTVNGRVGTLEGSVTTLSSRVTDSTHSFDELSGTVKSLDTQVETLSTKVESTGGTVQLLSGEVTTIARTLDATVPEYRTRYEEFSRQSTFEKA
jgi:archaellum component FlaC